MSLNEEALVDAFKSLDEFRDTNHPSVRRLIHQCRIFESFIFSLTAQVSAHALPRATEQSVDRILSFFRDVRKLCEETTSFSRLTQGFRINIEKIASLNSRLRELAVELDVAMEIDEAQQSEEDQLDIQSALDSGLDQIMHIQAHAMSDILSGHGKLGAAESTFFSPHLAVTCFTHLFGLLGIADEHMHEYLAALDREKVFSVRLLIRDVLSTTADLVQKVQQLGIEVESGSRNLSEVVQGPWIEDVLTCSVLGVLRAAELSGNWTQLFSSLDILPAEFIKSALRMSLSACFDSLNGDATTIWTAVAESIVEKVTLLLLELLRTSVLPTKQPDTAARTDQKQVSLEKLMKWLLSGPFSQLDEYYLNGEYHAADRLEAFQLVIAHYSVWNQVSIKAPTKESASVSCSEICADAVQSLVQLFHMDSIVSVVIQSDLPTSAALLTFQERIRALQGDCAAQASLLAEFYSSAFPLASTLHLYSEPAHSDSADHDAADSVPTVKTIVMLDNNVRMSDVHDFVRTCTKHCTDGAQTDVHVDLCNALLQSGPRADLHKRLLSAEHSPFVFGEREDMSNRKILWQVLRGKRDQAGGYMAVDAHRYTTVSTSTAAPASADMIPLSATQAVTVTLTETSVPLDKLEYQKGKTTSFHSTLSAVIEQHYSLPPVSDKSYHLLSTGHKIAPDDFIGELHFHSTTEVVCKDDRCNGFLGSVWPDYDLLTCDAKNVNRSNSTLSYLGPQRRGNPVEKKVQFVCDIAVVKAGSREDLKNKKHVGIDLTKESVIRTSVYSSGDSVNLVFPPPFPEFLCDVLFTVFRQEGGEKITTLDDKTKLCTCTGRLRVTGYLNHACVFPPKASSSSSYFWKADDGKATEFAYLAKLIEIEGDYDLRVGDSGSPLFVKREDGSLALHSFYLGKITMKLSKEGAVFETFYLLSPSYLSVRWAQELILEATTSAFICKVTGATSTWTVSALNT